MAHGCSCHAILHLWMLVVSLGVLVHWVLFDLSLMWTVSDLLVMGLATMLTLDILRDCMHSSKVLTAAHSVAFVAF